MSLIFSLTLLLCLLFCQSCAIGGNKHEVRARLFREQIGINELYYQRKPATNAEIIAGNRALAKWLVADNDERNRLADDIIVSQILLGKEKDQLIKYLGKPSCDTDFEINWNALGSDSCGDSVCNLCVKIKNGKTVEAYLDVNH